jgi:hypothetical protein
LNLKCDILVSKLAFKSNLYRYIEDAGCEVNRANLRAFEEYDEARYGTRPNFFSFSCAKSGGGGGGGDGDGSGHHDEDEDNHGNI